MKKLFVILLAICCLAGCAKKSVSNELKFEVKTEENGKKIFYLFDDNSEHLNPDFLVDGENPSAIASFRDLEEGVYTVFSYHHRGTAAEENEDLFFNTLFRSAEIAEIKILAVGINNAWDWRQAWADYTGKTITADEYYRTASGETITDEVRYGDKNRYGEMGEVVVIDGGEALLTDILPEIAKSGMNEIRHGCYQEPIWLMMQFEVVSGTIDFDTIAYKNETAARNNFDNMSIGKFYDEPQYKGIAENSADVYAELGYEIEDETVGNLPVKVFNQKYPNGISVDTFATNVNTWKREEVTTAESAESDLMELVYDDGDEVYYFNPFYSKNGEKMADLEPSDDDEFYRNNVLNLGNFGVTYHYTIDVKNSSSMKKIFEFKMNSNTGQVYRFHFYDKNGNEVKGTEDFLTKRFDDCPKDGTEAEKYSTSEYFHLEAGESYKIEVEITTLTGCNAPMEISFAIQND